MNEKSHNPISLRSRRMISQALLQLMEEKPFHKISIKEITATAELVRKTFYRNFQTKEDVLKEYITELMKEAEQQFESLDALTPYAMANIYFKFWQKHRHFLKLLQQNDLFVIVLKQLDDYVPFINSRYKSDLIQEFDDTFIEYYNVFNTAGIWHMLEKWISRGTKETPEQLAQIYSDITLNNPNNKTLKK
ncbi:AcrR family transcriptional regulator [Pullulanibacillus camelliae]|uniref:AcrR family transcriptional regulator n=1 Tax=Pullulanibacillus camelliae TaxID=1707096 RepID=A0A8J2VJE8_9BACL|nr:TetR/AcrR family transcriptional regulator [Pullulanibacillus camelliae]GGE32672.1 AcrR family transcriptional regulator [Pullulanibacillus camelliae]